MHVVITGVAGFIGSNLADRLVRDGHRVTGIDSLAYGVREQVPAGVQFVEADIRDPHIVRSLKDAGALFHLAAKNCIPDCEDDPVETASINVEGTVNVFEACRRAGVPKIIYAETSALYEGSTTLPSREEDVSPRSFYAISKFAGMAFARRYEQHFGMNMTALRYFNVYGPRQDYRRTVPPLMSAFILKLLNGEPPVIYGSGEKRRDFVYVDDVNDFHALCLTDDRVKGGTFNLGSGTNYSVLEVYEKITGLLGTHIPPVHRPDMPGDEAQQTLAEISSARALGWKPRISLEDGLTQSIRFIREHVLRDGESLHGDRKDPEI